MTCRLHLGETPGPRWHRSGRARARGWAYTPDGRLLDGEALAAYLDGPTEALRAKLEALSGEYAVVLEGDGAVAAAVDRIRSLPLFYGRDAAGALHLGDDALVVARSVGARLDHPAAAAELMPSSVVTGPDTLSSAVHQVQAGALVRLTADATQRQRYFRFGEGAALEGTAEELEREGARVIESAFAPFLASVEGRPVAVPLSGGMDSRLVATLLARAGRTDAVCFSYGRRTAFEARASRRVAERLGLRWHFVPYTARDWHRRAASDGYRRFRQTAGGLGAIEHEQDWPAVRSLMDQQLVPEGAVFVPGHSGDFLGGSHLPPAPIADPVADVWRRYYTEWPRSALPGDLAEALRRRIARRLEDARDPEAAFTAFGWQERQAKLIANSVRVYEHFGAGWRLPLWADRALLDFWGRVPPPLRQRLYRRVLHGLLGELFALPATPRPAPRLARRLQRLTDYDLRRYGIWLAPPAPLTALHRRVGDLAALDHPVVGPVVEALARPIARRPVPWATVNGLLALARLDALCRELG